MHDQPAALESLERANKDIARAFNQAWSARDCDALTALLADDVSYMVYEGGPIHHGIPAVDRTVRRFMARFARIEFRILRITAIGAVVIHERSEHYYAPDGTLDTRFHVTGLLVIRDGQITDWRDYAVPGAEQLAGPLCTQKPAE